MQVYSGFLGFLSGINSEVHKRPLNYDWPAALADTAAPCRAKLNCIDRDTGNKMTKRRYDGRDSDQPINRILYGKSERDIYKNKLPAAAQELIAQLQRNGLVETAAPAELHDLEQLARAHAEDFIDQLRRERKLEKETVQKYLARFRLLIPALAGYTAEGLRQDDYAALQEAIRVDALRTAHSLSKGERQREAAAKTVTSSGALRLELLTEFLNYLEEFENIQIPAVPVTYQGDSLDSNARTLRELRDDVRRQPEALVQYVVAHRGDSTANLLLLLCLECGLRHNEALGLLWGSLRQVDGTQGPMYYLEITGQWGADDDKRKERTKTSQSYRVIPLPIILGRELWAHREALEHRCGDLRHRLMAGAEVNGVFYDDAKIIAKRDAELEEAFAKAVENTNTLELLMQQHPYLYNENKQRGLLEAACTLHSLRRNYYTRLHTQGGLPLRESLRQMGHLPSELAHRSSHALEAKTEQEIYRMCLAKQTGYSAMQPQMPLRYPVAQKARETEVPATGLAITLAPGQTAEVMLQDTEPGNRIRLEYDDSGVILRSSFSYAKETNNFEQDRLLANERLNKIVRKSKPFKA